MRIRYATVYASGIAIDTVALNGASRGRVKNCTVHAFKSGFVIEVNDKQRTVKVYRKRGYIRLPV